MNHRVRLLTLSAAVALSAGLARAQQDLPAHAANLMKQAPATQVGSENVGMSGDVIDAYLTFWPSPKEDRVQDALGFGFGWELPVNRTVGLRLDAGYESWEVETGDTTEDATIIPLGLAFVVGPPPMGRFRGGLALGLKYLLVDLEDEGGSYENALVADIGLQVRYGVSAGLDLVAGVGYQTGIQDSENDANEEFSLDGVYLRVGLGYRP
jgi:hypothetical protein